MGTWRALLVITLLVVLALGLSLGPSLLSAPSSSHLSESGVRGAGGLETLLQLELLGDTER